MKDDCLVCHGASVLPTTHVKNIFEEKISDKAIAKVLEDILNQHLHKYSIHSKSLCGACHQMCVDYVTHKNKLDKIKKEMTEEYNKRLQKSPTKVSPGKTLSKVVVPASKLLPVPADFQLNFGQLSQAVSKANVLSKAKPYNFKLSVGSSLLNPVATTPTVKITTPSVKITTPSVKITTPSDSPSILSTVSNSITQDWNTNMVPKDIFSTTEDENQNETDENLTESGENANQSGRDLNQSGQDTNESGQGTNQSGQDTNESGQNEENGDEEEHEMEIDEDCSVAMVPVKTEAQPDFINIKTESPQLAEYADIITLTEGDASKAGGNYVLSNFKIFNGDHSGDDDDDDEEQHTIVVNSDNASILEMMTGQKLIYENGGLSLVMEDNNDDNDDAQDSNEESQIELQVSGDEETTNAIIAAAQEQGGAFIKVESGAMYRVKSIASAGSEEQDSATNGRYVTQLGANYTCKLCRDQGNEEMANKLMDRMAMIQHFKKVHELSVTLPPRRGRRDVEESEMERSKNGKRLHVCVMCNKYFNSRTLLNEHINTHTGAKPYQCHICDKGFASKYTHQAHLKTHEERPRAYQCNQCNKAFLTTHNLKQHLKTHSGIKNFICKVCNKAFATQHNLDFHGVVHTRERPFVCAMCGKGFSRKAELLDHKRTHTGERPFECDICGARFGQRSNLHSHRRATHMDDKRHQCTECLKRFKRRRLLEYHIKASHTGERPLKCEVCPATFVYPEHYKKHMKIHTGLRPYFCEICGKSFNSRDNRNTHRFTHSEKKPYECLACGHSYMRKRALIQHMNESGHLAESIVVNQPRVTRVHKNESGLAAAAETDQNDAQTEPAIFRTTGKLESLDKNTATIIAEDGKFFIETVPETMSSEADASALLEAVSATPLDEQATHFGTDENGAVLRLIQVKLPNGADGWVALND